MEIPEALAVLRTHQNGVLVTQRRDGRPQLSNIIHAVGDDGIVRISVTADRAKAKNLQHTPKASLYTTSDDFWSYVVIDADAELTPVAADPSDATVDELVEHYRSIRGEHPDWDEFRQSMVNDQRQAVRLTPTHAYGTWRG